ncbi:MAG: methylmalonyl-CoA mutase family protein, partial [Mycobacteriales bacterium]
MEETAPPDPRPPEELSLLAGGEAHTSADWERAAAAVLRKAGRLSADDPDSAAWEALTTTTLDGIDVPPLGTRETASGVPVAGLPGQAPYTRGAAAVRVDTGWDVRASLADPDAKLANEAVLTDLENGVTSLWLTLGPGGIDVDDLSAVLAGVHLDLAPVVL